MAFTKPTRPKPELLKIGQIYNLVDYLDKRYPRYKIVLGDDDYDVGSYWARLCIDWKDGRWRIYTDYDRIL